jgi:hypothetical protein
MSALSLPLFLFSHIFFCFSSSRPPGVSLKGDYHRSWRADKGCHKASIAKPSDKIRIQKDLDRLESNPLTFNKDKFRVFFIHFKIEKTLQGCNLKEEL